MKKKLLVRRFVSPEDVKAASPEALLDIRKISFSNASRCYMIARKICMLVQSDYFEGGYASVTWTILDEEFYLIPKFLDLIS